MLYFKNFFFLSLLLSIMSLNACAIAVVGAMGAAGVSASDDHVKPSASNAKLPVTAPSAVKLDPPLVKTELPNAPVDEIIGRAVTQPPMLNAPVIEPQIEHPGIENSAPFKSAEVILLPPATQSINRTSVNQLTMHPWKVIGIRRAPHLNFNVDNTVFIFSKNNDFKAFVSCHTFAGKFEADADGKFFLTKLTSSNEHCEEPREQEVLIESLLLSANFFVINDETLMLGSQGVAELAFAPTYHSMSFNAVTKSKQTKKAGQITKHAVKGVVRNHQKHYTNSKPYQKSH